MTPDGGFLTGSRGRRVVSGNLSLNLSRWLWRQAHDPLRHFSLHLTKMLHQAFKVTMLL